MGPQNLDVSALMEKLGCYRWSEYESPEKTKNEWNAPKEDKLDEVN
jgi:hypothetical protein